MDTLISILKGFAPALATAVAGPAGAAVVSAIAGRLDVPSTVEAVTTALTADPKLSERLNELEMEYAKLDAADRSDARDREIKIATALDAPLINKVVTPVLALGVVGMSFVLLSLMVFVTMDASQERIVIYVLGAVNAATVQVLSYYFGASHDHKKDFLPEARK